MNIEGKVDFNFQFLIWNENFINKNKGFKNSSLFV